MWAVVDGYTSLSDFLTALKPFVSLKEAHKKTVWSLLTSDMLGIASTSILKTSGFLSSWHKVIVTGFLKILAGLGLKHAQKVT